MLWKRRSFWHSAARQANQPSAASKASVQAQEDDRDMKILLTGAAGFIGYHTAHLLLQRGDQVLGLDSLNDYYAVTLKQARLGLLEQFDGFRFVQADIADTTHLAKIAASGGFSAIVHLAAQAGVRHSLENPQAYVHSNVAGQVAILHLTARLRVPLVYASSSSVYGTNDKVPFAETDRVDRPVSVYAATKRAGELLAGVYAGTHGVVSTGLRFFTVYGRYGRPDMAPWLFTDAKKKIKHAIDNKFKHMERHMKSTGNRSFKKISMPNGSKHYVRRA